MTSHRYIADSAGRAEAGWGKVWGRAEADRRLTD